jgi:hypothetical protein
MFSSQKRYSLALTVQILRPFPGPLMAIITGNGQMILSSLSTSMVGDGGPASVPDLSTAEIVLIF